MYCVVYEFRIIAGHNSEFERTWVDVTKAIHRVCGSLGSRLHKTDDPALYIAYAQWPSKEIFEADLNGYTDAEEASRQALKSTLVSVKKVYGVDMIHDHLIK